MSDTGGDEQSDMVASIYEAAAGFGSWEGVGRDLIDALEGSSALLMVVSPDSGPCLVAMPGCSPTALRLYADYYHRFDLWADLGKTRLSMRAALGTDFVSEDVLERSEFWNDYARPHVGAFHMVGAAFPLEERCVGILGIHRPRDAPAFDADSRVRVERLLPHIRSGLRLRSRIAGQACVARAAEDALALLDFGVVIVSADGTCSYANPEAERIAAVRDTLLLGGRGRAIDAARPDDARKLRLLVSTAAYGGAGGALKLPRPDDRPPVAVLVTPLPTSLTATQAGEGRRLVMVALHDLAREVRLPATILREVFGLTPAEARLAIALCEGKDLAEIAEEQQVARSTLRFHLSAVLAKTETRRQSDLVRRLTRLPKLMGRFPSN